MSRLAELIRELCPDGVEYKPLSECAVLPSIPKGLKRNQYENSGSYPIVDQGKGQIAGFTCDETKLVRDVPGIVFGDHTREIKYVDYIFVPGADGVKWIRAVDGVSIRYLFHCLASLSIPSRGYNRHWILVREMLIPVPPLEVQREIVRILDQFTTLEAELEAELEARRTQYEHYRNHLLSYDSIAAHGPVEMVELGDIATRVVTGVTPQASNSRYYQDGSNPWIRTQDVNFNRISAASEFVTDHAIDDLPLKWVKANSVIVAISGASAGRSAILGIDAVTNHHCCNLEIDSNCADYRYVYYSLAARYTELRGLGRGARGDLNVSIIKSFEIPVPSLEEQRRIADLLDRFDALVNDISSGLPAEIAARRAQYEHYRDRLLSFPEKVVSVSDAS